VLGIVWTVHLESPAILAASAPAQRHRATPGARGRQPGQHGPNARPADIETPPVTSTRPAAETEPRPRPGPRRSSSCGSTGARPNVSGKRSGTPGAGRAAAPDSYPLTIGADSRPGWRRRPARPNPNGALVLCVNWAALGLQATADALPCVLDCPCSLGSLS